MCVRAYSCIKWKDGKWAVVVVCVCVCVKSVVVGRWIGRYMCDDGDVDVCGGSPYERETYPPITR